MRQCYVPVLQMDSNEMRQRVVKVVIVRLVQWELVRFPSVVATCLLYPRTRVHVRPRVFHAQGEGLIAEVSLQIAIRRTGYIHRGYNSYTLILY